MSRRAIRRRVRHLMRHLASLETYPGPVAPGWRERIESDIHAWITCLRPHGEGAVSDEPWSEEDRALLAEYLPGGRFHSCRVSS